MIIRVLDNVIALTKSRILAQILENRDKPDTPKHGDAAATASEKVNLAQSQWMPVLESLLDSVIESVRDESSPNLREHVEASSALESSAAALHHVFLRARECSKVLLNDVTSGKPSVEHEVEFVIVSHAYQRLLLGPWRTLDQIEV